MNRKTPALQKAKVRAAVRDRGEAEVPSEMTAPWEVQARWKRGLASTAGSTDFLPSAWVTEAQGDRTQQAAQVLRANRSAPFRLRIAVAGQAAEPWSQI